MLIVGRQARELYRLVQNINERMALVATQADVDALTARLDAGVSDVRQDIADLKAAHPELDLSALESSVGSLESLGAENPSTSG